MNRSENAIEQSNNHVISLFQERVAVLATMHQKERVIAPLLENSLGLQIQVPSQFDTDRFGTFTREVKRAGDQLAAARLKAEAAMELTGCTIGLASEGSFVPHPMLPYLSQNREIVMLIDRQQELEIIGQVVSSQTNYNHQQVNSVEAALAFAQKVGFPQHGLVVMAAVGANATPVNDAEMIKGITQEADLVNAVQWALDRVGTAHLETDMRALYNPTRMQVIAEATQDLIQKILRCCPQCQCPGFSIVEHLPGLRCGLCFMPTPLTRAVVYRCQKCHFQQEQPAPEGTETADPMYCSYCNP